MCSILHCSHSSGAMCTFSWQRAAWKSAVRAARCGLSTPFRSLPCLKNELLTPCYTGCHNYVILKYRSRQYCKFKVLHITEVNWFSTIHLSLKIWCKILKNVVVPINMVLLTPSKLKLVGYLLHNRPLIYLKRNVILVNFEAKWLKIRCLRELWRLILDSIIGHFCCKVVKTSVINGATAFLNSLYKKSS